MWSFSAVSAEDRADYLEDERKTDIYLMENESVLLAGNAFYVAGLSPPRDGSLLWEVDKYYDVNFLAVSPDRTRFAVFNDFTDGCVSIHSAKDGRTVCWSYLPKICFRYEGRSIQYPFTFSDYSGGKSFGGNFSADGQSVLFGNRIYRTDGSSELLESSDSGEFGSFTNYAVSGQADTGDVYTAYALRKEGTDRIFLWKNEEERGTFSMDGDTQLLFGDSLSKNGMTGDNALLAVSGRGQVVAGLKKKNDPRFTGYFLVSPEGEVSTMHAVCGTLPSSPFCFANEKSDFAVLETDGVLRIYEPGKEAAREITAEDGFAGAVSLCFSPDDRFLGVLSYNGELTVYDAPSGQKVLQDQDSLLATTYGTVELRLALAAAGERLVCIAAETEYADRSNGVVYDLAHGEKVAQIPGLWDYSPEFDKTVLFHALSALRKYFLGPLYDAEQLLQEENGSGGSKK